MERGMLISGRRISANCLVVVSEDNVPMNPVYVDVPPPNWPEHFRALLLSELGADVRFRVGGETFPAHRIVLAARSPVLKAQLFGDGGAIGPDDVHVDGVTPDVFRHLLHFIYTDSLPSSSEEEQGKVDDEAAMARHLLEAADRYGLERLRLLCEKRLCDQVDAATVAATLAWAEQHRCYGLKLACLAFVKFLARTGALSTVEGFEDFIRAHAFHSLLRELMLHVAGLPPPDEEVVDDPVDDDELQLLYG